MKKLLSIILSVAITGTFMPATIAAENYLDKSDDFESYTVGDNWIESVPSGWKIFSSGDTSTAEIEIAADPLDSDNKVLKIKGVSSAAAAASSSPVYNRVIFQTTGSSYVPDPLKNIVLKTKCYIDSDTVSGLYNGNENDGPGKTGKNIATVNAISTNSQGNPFTVLYLRRDKNTGSSASVYKRSGKYGSDYYADTVVPFQSGKWVEVVHVLSTANGLAEYRQYIDGELTTLTQKNGDLVSDLKAQNYDGTAASSVVSNMYGISNAVITANDAAEGKEPVMYIDDVAIFEVDADRKLEITDITSDEVKNDFDLENSFLSFTFSEAVDYDVLLKNLYIANGSNKLSGADIHISDDGLTADVYLSNVSGLKGGNTYKVCVDTGMYGNQFIPLNSAFETEFTTKTSEEPENPDGPDEPDNPDNPPVEPEPIPEGVLMNELINENMESFNLDANWLTSTPEGWQITQSNGKLSDAEVKIVSDPTDENNKVLKISPGMHSAVNNENISVFASTGGVKTTGENLKKILIKMKVYIPSETAVGMPDANMSGKDYSALGGVSMSSNGANLFSVSTLRKETSDDGTVVKMYSRTGATSSIWYGEKMHTLPLDRWFEFAHVVDISDIGENAEFPTYWYKQYIDGVPTVLTLNKQEGKPQTTDMNRSSYTGVPFKDGYFENFFGVLNRVAVAPKATVAPVIYIDDVYASVIEEYAPIVVSDKADTNPYSDIVLKFPYDFTDDNKNLLKNSISVERKVFDEINGYTFTKEKGAFSVIFDDENNLKITPENGLKYNSDYVVKIDSSLATKRVEGIFDKNFIKLEKTEIPFKTKKSEEISIDLNKGIINLDGASSISDADSVTYQMKLENSSTADIKTIVSMALYNGKNKLIKVDFEKVTVPANSDSTATLFADELGGEAEYAVLYVFKDNLNSPGAMLQIPDILK